MIFLVHLAGDAARCGEGLAGRGDNHFVGINRLGFFNRLLPHVEADVGGLHWVVGQWLVHVARNLLGFGAGRPFFDELGVGRILDRLKVVPGGQVTDERFGVDAAQFFLTH